MPGSHIMFDTLDFLATAISELHLAGSDVPVTTGTRPPRSNRSKTEKWCLNRHIDTIKKKAP
jgi:hypothetical protein